jgi:hypothetical protein
VPERQQLPSGSARFSLIVKAVEAVLSEHGWFPREFRPTDDFDRVLIERKADGTVWTHERYEIGVMRFSDPKSVCENSLDAAVERYLKHISGSNIDGVAIDWDG